MVLAWIGGGPVAVAPIVGVSTAAQISEALGARQVRLTPEQRAALDAAA